MEKTLRASERDNSSVKKRANRQGKPLRKRSPRVALPTGKFRFTDGQWSEVERSGFPSEGRKTVEIYVTIYRNTLEEELSSIIPSETRQSLQRLAEAAKKFCDEFQLVIDDSRAWEHITSRPGWPFERVARLERDLLELPEGLTKAANLVRRTHPGVAADKNLLGFVNSLAALWEEHMGQKFTRAKKRTTVLHPINFITSVGRIADPPVLGKT